jgi:hypothetical protein
MNEAVSVYVLIGLVVVVAILVSRDALNREPTSPDRDSFTSNDERCQALRIRQAEARARMKKLGHQSLLDGKPAWQRINPMHTPESPNRVVTLITRGKR